MLTARNMVAAEAPERAPLRVLHLHSGNLYGGIETVLVTLARFGEPSLSQRFALCFEGRLTEELRSSDARLVALGRVRLSRPWQVLRARRRLRAELGARPCDVAVCHSSWSYSIFSPVCRRAGTPVAFWMHASPEGRHWLERWAGRVGPEVLLVNSKFTGARASKMFRRTSPALVYYPYQPPGPSAAAQRNRTRCELDTPEGTVVIVQVSRMEPWKGQAVLLEALAKLRTPTPWICWIVGGAQRPEEHDFVAELEERRRASGLAGRVRFLGTRDDVPALLAAADIFCQPNLGPEPFGVVFLEALAARLPVVASAAGGVLEIVDETCGVLVPPGNASALGSALEGLIDDSRARHRMGAAGPERVGRLSDPAQQIATLKGALAGALRN